MSTGLHDNKAPMNLNHWRSDGDTIPWVSPAGGEVVGQIMTLEAASQLIGIVNPSITHELKTTAEAGDVLQVRLTGMIESSQMAAADVAAGAFVSWTGTEFAANATGGHLMIEGYTDATDAYGVILMNAVQRAAT